MTRGITREIEQCTMVGECVFSSSKNAMKLNYILIVLLYYIILLYNYY